jgi:predicted lipoprotein with Yx(FWY)xxD motif
MFIPVPASIPVAGPDREGPMRLHTILLAAAALLPLAAHAEDYAGGAIKTAEVGGHEILTGANGMTLYTFDKDEGGVSACYGDCAVKWPPATAEAGAMADGDFTLVDRTDGTKQWAYKGMPLYFWYEDMAPGDTKGDGVGGVWHTAMEMDGM